MRQFRGTPEIAFEREDVIRAMEFYLNHYVFKDIQGPSAVKVDDLQISNSAKYVLRMKIVSKSK